MLPARDENMEMRIGRKSKEARSGCILAKSARRFESSCPFSAAGKAIGDEVTKGGGMLNRLLMAN
jgi:hypothetical protein